MDVPHVSYLISLAVADFAVYHDKVGHLPVDYYVTKRVDGDGPPVPGQDAADDRLLQREDRPAVSLSQVRPGLRARVRRRHGEHLGHDDDRPGLLDEIAALEGDADGLVAHELAHQWFGDLLTCEDWSHAWLNEGFVAYFDPLFTSTTRRGRPPVRDGRGASGYLGNDRSYRRPIVETHYSRPTTCSTG